MSYKAASGENGIEKAKGEGPDDCLAGYKNCYKRGAYNP